ncbi:MAG: hypothetical protein ACAI38_00340 [Myxococcota bacterium]
MTKGTDAFGAPGLISSDIAPTYEQQRTLNAARERVLWLGLALGAVNVSTGRYLGESIWSVAARGIAVVLVTVAVGLLFTGSATRFGVGSGPLSRSAFGARAAMLVHLLRWGVGLAWTATHLQPFAEWLGLLVQATAVWGAPQVGLEWTATPELTGYGTLAVLGVALGWVARGRVRRSRLTARVLIALGGAAFVVLFAALVISRSWMLAASRPFSPHVLLDQVGAALIDALMLVWAVPEWVRYRERYADNRPPWRWLIGASIAVPVLLVGLAAVSQSARGHSDASLIGDAAGAFGLAFGWLGATVALALTFAVLPLFGVLTAALALCSAIPRWRYPYVAYATAFLAAGLAGFATIPSWVFALCLPPLAAIAIDEWLIRRRLVVLDLLYTYGSTRLSASLATLTGCGLIVFDHEHLVASAAGGMLVAMIGTALPLLGKLGGLRLPKRKAKARGKGPDDWADRPVIDPTWSADDTTHVGKPDER